MGITFDRRGEHKERRSILLPRIVQIPSVLFQMAEIEPKFARQIAPFPLRQNTSQVSTRFEVEELQRLRLHEWGGEYW
jgi:hypothetical protein